MENIRDFLAVLFSNKNVRRWTVEGLLSIAIGIVVGCITFNALSSEKKHLTVSAEGAAAPIVEESETQLASGEGLPEEDPDSDVVIEVVEGSAPLTDGEYAPAVANWSGAEIEAAVNERSDYRHNNKYQGAVTAYWEGVREVTDIAAYAMYLFDTDTRVYTAEDFAGLSPEVIHIAKNEIYARHGYSFKDKDLYNYFMGQIWYNPTVLPADFSEDTFSETEVKNLDLLNSLDTL